MHDAVQLQTDRRGGQIVEDQGRASTPGQERLERQDLAAEAQRVTGQEAQFGQ